MMKQKKVGLINYYQKGNDPKLLINTGTHGDEYSVIKHVTDYILEHENELPDFIYIPEVSPSAVALKTRRNKNNLDINRNFFEFSNEPEIKDNLEIMKKFNFDLCLTIHEDFEYSEFYLYDSETFDKSSWSGFTDKVRNIGLEVLNGVDDPADPVLGHTFVDGYFSHNHLKHDPNAGNLTDYLLLSNTAKRIVLPEVPTNASEEIKEKIVRLIFSDLLIILL